MLYFTTFEKQVTDSFNIITIVPLLVSSSEESPTRIRQLFVIVFYCLGTSSTIDVLSNEWPLEIKSLLLLLLVVVVVV